MNQEPETIPYLYKINTEVTLIYFNKICLFSLYRYMFYMYFLIIMIHLPKQKSNCLNEVGKHCFHLKEISVAILPQNYFYLTVMGVLLIWEKEKHIGKNIGCEGNYLQFRCLYRKKMWIQVTERDSLIFQHSIHIM